MVGALFLSAGGYHHHLGVNTWSSEGGSRPPADALGLISFSIVLPDAAAVRLLQERLAAAGSPVRADEEGNLRAADPDGNFIELSAR
jgi:catechol 2,3-dioxygenase